MLWGLPVVPGETCVGGTESGKLNCALFSPVETKQTL